MAEPTGMRRSKWRGWLFWAALCGLAWVVGAGALAVSSVRAYSIPTASMAPTLKPGDRIGVDTRPRRPPGRGELWVFTMPAASKAGGSTAVKRVIGLPGETVEVAGGKVLIDGRPLDEPYLSGPIPYSFAPITLGRDEYFMLGDSRGVASDSHIWGPLTADHLIGPVKVRYWPLRRVGGF